MGARDTAYNPTSHVRMKHVARRHYFMVESFEIVVSFVRTCDNWADFFTKPLPSKTFFFMRDAIMNVRPDESIPTPVDGPVASDDKYQTAMRAQPEPGPKQRQRDSIESVSVSPG